MLSYDLRNMVGNVYIFAKSSTFIQYYNFLNLLSLEYQWTIWSYFFSYAWEFGWGRYYILSSSVFFELPMDYHLCTSVLKFISFFKDSTESKSVSRLHGSDPQVSWQWRPKIGWRKYIFSILQRQLKRHSNTGSILHKLTDFLFLLVTKLYVNHS